MHSIEAVSKKGLLTILFVASFAVPLIIGGRYLSYFSQKSAQSDEEDTVFPKRLVLQGHNAYLSIRHNAALNPKVGEDFIISAWYTLEDLPTEDRDVVLFSKVDNEARAKPGFSLSLTRRGSVIRPVVYWKDKEGAGGVYEFSDIRILPRVWTNFVLSLKDGTLLGLNSVMQTDDRRSRRVLLGGFRFATPVYASADSSLIFGEKGGDLHGTIGPIGVFSAPHLLADFNRTFRKMSKDPLALTDIFDAQDVLLFSVDGTVDTSLFHHTIIHSPMLEKVNRLDKADRGAEQTSSK